MHNNSRYILLNFFFKEKCHDKIAITHIKIEFHLINDFKVKMLIKMNVLKFEKIILNFDDKIIMISVCQNMKMSIFFHRKNSLINRIIKTTSQIIVSIDKIVKISIQIKNTIISINKNNNFHSQSVKLLNFESEYFAYVTDFNFVTVQIKNFTIKLFIISKNFKIKHLRDYDKKNFFNAFKEFLFNHNVNSIDKV